MLQQLFQFIGIFALFLILKFNYSIIQQLLSYHISTVLVARNRSINSIYSGYFIPIRTAKYQSIPDTINGSLGNPKLIQFGLKFSILLPIFASVVNHLPMGQFLIIVGIPKLDMISFYKIFQRWLVGSQGYIFPCDAFKKLMLLQFLQFYPLFGVFLQQFDEHISEMLANEPYHPIQYIFDDSALYVGLDLLIGIELIVLEHIPGKPKFEHKHPNCPDIHLHTILSRKHFRCCVLQRAHKSIHSTLTCNDHPAKPIVCQFHMAVTGDQDVLRLEFSVDDAILVEDFNADYYLRYQVPDQLLSENAVLVFEVEINVTLRKVLHDDVDLIVVLESLTNGHKHVIKTNFPHFLTLQHIKFLNLRLVDDLHGVLLVTLLILGQHYVPERTPTQILYRLVVLRTCHWVLRENGVMGKLRARLQEFYGGVGVWYRQLLRSWRSLGSALSTANDAHPDLFIIFRSILLIQPYHRSNEIGQIITGK